MNSLLTPRVCELHTLQPQCQVSELISLSEYLEKHAKVSKVLRSERERKSYIQNVLGLQVQKDPTKNGALAVAVPKHTLMLSGTRMSSERVKEQRFDSKEESKDAFSKAKAGVEVKLNTKDQASSFALILTHGIIEFQ